MSDFFRIDVQTWDIGTIPSPSRTRPKANARSQYSDDPFAAFVDRQSITRLVAASSSIECLQLARPTISSTTCRTRACSIPDHARLWRQAPSSSESDEQGMLSAYVIVIQAHRFFLSEGEDASGALAKFV
jgi:hypothetical protein